MIPNRNDADAAREIMEALLPNQDTRKEILGFLAAAIRQADALAPEGWSLTLTNRMVRLNVGKIETLAIFENLLHLVLLAGRGPKAPKQIEGIDWNPNAQTVYPTVPGSTSCDIPADRFQSVRPQVAKFHSSLIERAATTSVRTTWARSHSPGVLRFLESSLGITLPSPAYWQASRATVNPVIGAIYSWSSVKQWGGTETCLSTRGGRIFCATLGADANPTAPGIVVFGNAPRVASRAARLFQQIQPIHMFIKEVSDRWRYRGRYEVARFLTKPDEMAPFSKDATGPVSCVIFFRPADGQDDLNTPPDIEDDIASAPEGRLAWFQHFRRERDPKLVKAKKDKVLSKTGKLVCEVCSFNFTEFYRPHAKKFCEVHHRTPLAKLDGETITRLADLAILCANCHRVIHKIKPMPSVEGFRGMIRRQSSKA